MQRMKMDILKSTIIVYLVVSNYFGNVFCENKRLTKDPKIVIIGAGASGIAAASKLFENGFTDVTILEAEDRIGGRVYTTKFGEYLVDLGGQWVDGEDGNIAFELANPLGLLDVILPYEESGFVSQEFYNSNGHRINSGIERELKKFFCDYVSGIDIGEDSDIDSIGEYVEQKYNKVFQNNSEMLKDKEKYLDFLQLLRLADDAADSWYDVSIKESANLIKVYPGNSLINWKERGYSTILDILMKRLPNPKEELPVINNTLLNTEVISIDYLSDTEGPPVLVTSMKGELFRADHVIVTVSLGVLKEKHKSLFIPPLPDYKVKAIENTGFGSLSKIYVLFDEPFWHPNGRPMLFFNFLWNDSDRKEIEADPERRWLLGNQGAVTVEHKSNLLALWNSGKYAKEMETLSEEKVYSHVVENLHRFLDKSYNVTAPLAILRTRWFTNPHFRGTYSYRSLKSHDEKVLPEMIERPLNSDNLAVLFAGEATSDDRWGYVDGAIGSGWKAANRLIKRYKKSV